MSEQKIAIVDRREPAGRVKQLEYEAIRRFWLKVVEGAIAPRMVTPCWIWTASTTHDGYGRFEVKCADGKFRARMAHIWSWEAENGPVPDGLNLDHLCRVRCCVRPSHVEPVTVGENIRRGDTGKANRLKSHCALGHPYSGDNLIVAKGQRRCRVCSRRYARESYHRRKRAA